MSTTTRDRIAFYASAAFIAAGIYCGMDFPKALLHVASMIVLWGILWAVFARAFGADGD